MLPTQTIGFILGGGEIIILLFVLVVLFFGPDKIPKLARSTGEATQEWKKGREELEEEIEQEKQKENAEENQ